MRHVCVEHVDPCTPPHCPVSSLSPFDLSSCICAAETERQGTDHLDLAGLPQRSTAASDSTHTLATTPESRKKSKGIKKLFGRWVGADAAQRPVSSC